MQTITLTKSGTYTYTLDKEGSELNVVGRFWLKGNNNLDLNLTVIHAAKNTSATVSLKAVVEGRGQANLNGNIIVQKNAQNTNSFLEERVLLLSDDARTTAIPNLEIEADQVKCSHAATVGRVNDEALFYLQSRGLSKTAATHLIAEGFLEA
jgi:Fe-S cluster assembly protein SufD